MSLQSLLTPKCAVKVLEYYGPEIGEILEYQEEFYSPENATVSLHLSLEKMQAVFHRLTMCAVLFKVERSEEMRVYMRSLAKTVYACCYMFEEHPNRVPANPDQLFRGSALLTCHLPTEVSRTKDDDPSKLFFQFSLNQIFKQHRCDQVESTIVRVNTDDLKPVQRHFTPVSPKECALSEHRLLINVLEYAFMPTLEEMILIKWKDAAHLDISFQYPLLAERLTDVTKLCDSVGSHFGMRILSDLVPSRVAQVTYYYRAVGLKRECTNADRTSSDQTCHWYMNLSQKVAQLVSAKNGCKDSAVCKIAMLFMRYGIEPKSTVTVAMEMPKFRV